MSISIAHPERYDTFDWFRHPVPEVADEWECLGFQEESELQEDGYMWGHLKPAFHAKDPARDICDELCKRFALATPETLVCDVDDLLAGWAVRDDIIRRLVKYDSHEAWNDAVKIAEKQVVA